MGRSKFLVSTCIKMVLTHKELFNKCKEIWRERQKVNLFHIYNYYWKNYQALIRNSRVPLNSRLDLISSITIYNHTVGWDATLSIWGHSTTTWTKFYHFWPPSLCVDSFYNLSVDKNILLIPSPLNLPTYIVIEWPLYSLITLTLSVENHSVLSFFVIKLVMNS